MLDVNRLSLADLLILTIHFSIYIFIKLVLSWLCNANYFFLVFLFTSIIIG